MSTFPSSEQTRSAVSADPGVQPAPAQAPRAALFLVTPGTFWGHLSDSETTSLLRVFLSTTVLDSGLRSLLGPATVVYAPSKVSWGAWAGLGWGGGRRVGSAATHCHLPALHRAGFGATVHRCELDSTLHLPGPRAESGARGCRLAGHLNPVLSPA